MDVLVDTSVWVAHFRDGHQDLAQLLALDRVLTHPLVLLELACGTPPQRGRMLADMARLRPAHQASQGEVLGLIQREQLWSLGCGAVDMTLLASALITPATHLWTLGRRLDALARRFGAAWQPIRREMRS